MRIAWLAMVVFGFVTCFDAPATGQICAGSTSFTRSPFLISAGGGVSRSAHGFGVAFTLGNPSQFFSVGIGTTHFDVLNGSSFDVDAGVGLERFLDPQERIELCQIVFVGHSAGPDHTPYGDYSETAVDAGLRLGDVAIQSTHARLILSLGLGLEHQQQTFSLRGAAFSKDTHDFGVFAAGVSAVFGNSLTVSPRVSVPIGLTNGEAKFTLGLAISLGH